MATAAPETEIANGPLYSDQLLKQLIEEQRILIQVMIEIRGILGVP